MKPSIAPEMVAVIARPEHTVRIVFADGEVRDVDITPPLDTPAFSPLRDRLCSSRSRSMSRPAQSVGPVTWT